MFSFTIRDVLWLTVVVGLAIGWWLDHRNSEQAAQDAAIDVAGKWADEVNHPVRYTIRGATVTTGPRFP